jgi:uncharacterized protein (TIGR03790 family)
MKRLSRALVWLAVSLPGVALALGPHEILLLSNGNSPDSVMVAKEFAKLRQVPEINVVRLNLPVPAAGQPAEVTPDDFTRLIWSPASRAAQERGIENQILAWIYSTDFPVAVKTSPELSIQGLTFLRNRQPDPAGVGQGTIASELFAGPDRTGATAAHLTRTLDVARDWLGQEMPLPSMMLGFTTGPTGNKKETVVQCLKKGRASDSTFPRGVIRFVTSGDIRSTCREWQFFGARQELLGMGIRAEVVDALPSGASDILGVMMGTANLPGALGRGYLPGCMAEHLTSAGAVFHSPDQSKLTAWIEAGATASSGAVSEPFSIWEKFPAARFYVHYAAGSCMIESFYQSIRCPLQILLVGDPLASPWAPKAELAIRSLERAKEGDPLRVRCDIAAEPAACFGRVVFLVDGKPVDEKAGIVSGAGGRPLDFEVKPRALAKGSHTLRVIAYRTGWLRSQVFAEKDFEVGPDGKAALKP